MPHSSIATPCELKFLPGSGVFEGYASVFNVVDSVNDRIAQGAFRESLEKFRVAGRLPPLLWQHNTLEPIGIWREMYEDSHGLFVKGELFIGDIPLAKEAYKLLQEHVVTGLSIGYRTQESHRDTKSGVRVLTKVELLEVSLVTFPANEQARVTGVKMFSGGRVPSEREFESFLRTSGLSRRQAKGIIACGYKALRQEENPAIERLKESMLRAAAEMKAAAACSPAEKLLVSLRAATLDNLKFSPSQPRAPRGTSEGGQWVDAGGGSGGGSSSRPSRSIPRSPSLDDLRRIDGAGLGHPLSPLDFIGGGGVLRALKPVAIEAVGAATAARNAVRVRGYLNEVRKIPKGVREIREGTKKLTPGQNTSLKDFRGKTNSQLKDKIEIVNFSDGSAIFSVRVPARDIAGSYRIYEKHVSASGEKITFNGITIGPKGELVHIKPK